MNIELEKNIQKNDLLEKQTNFLETNLGQAINKGIDFGLKAVLPNFIEDEIIEIKDSLLTEGISGAVSTAIENAINLGKSVAGIFTGKFESISQIKDVISKGGLLDSISDILDAAINFAKKEKLISPEIAKLLKKGKNTIIKNVEDSIDNTLTEQVNSIEKINKYVEKWKKSYEEKDFDSMENQYRQIEKYLNNIIPLENVITEAREVENIHKLIKNNGKNFNLSQEEKELVKILM